MTAITVIVATYDRCLACKRAVTSALTQIPPPLEVIVCDDGSTDDTQVEFERWSGYEPRLRYHRLPRNTGVPAIPRNLGISHAEGDWVAFLDDDDEWLPGKLALQSQFLTTSFDVVAGNALRTSGGLYFRDVHTVVKPTRHDVLCTNPIILSTAVARRSLVLTVGGFPKADLLRGTEDYALWLELADAGARFLVVPTPLAVYDDQGCHRFSQRRLAGHRAIAGHMLRRWMRRPVDRELASATLIHSFRALKVPVRASADYLFRWRHR